MEDKTKPEMTEGEKMIGYFMKSLKIKYDSQIPIKNLQNDSKTFRIADFYLPQYGVYLEFLGNWNHLERREEYRLKKEVYFKNNIPCVYIYPENLGAFDFLLDLQLEKQIKKHQKTKELKKYHFHKMRYSPDLANTTIYSLIFLAIFILSFIHFMHQQSDWHEYLISFSLLGLCFYQAFKAIGIYRRIKAGEYSLANINT